MIVLHDETSLPPPEKLYVLMMVLIDGNDANVM
jgi:hypothetical protein